MFSSSSYSRRLLYHSTSNLASPPTAIDGVDHNSSQPILGVGRFDAKVVMVLSIIACAAVFALGLHFAIRCSAYWCSRRVLESTEGATMNQPANTGVDKNALKAFTTLTYFTSLNLPECTICLSDFAAGERVRVLPKCNHGFHLKCIDTWLKSHTSCPNCRQCLLDTCEKIIGCNEATGESEPVLVPLQPEGLMVNHRSIC